MSKSDLQARPIFHRTQDSIRAHMLVCFMGLMMGKYMEIKTGVSLRKIREELWKVHEAQILDQSTGEVHVMQMERSKLTNSLLKKIGVPEHSH